MKKYLFDTNIISYLARKNEEMQQRFLALEPNAAICISVLTSAELRYGLAKRPVAREVRAVLEAYLAKLSVLSWTPACVPAYAELRVLNESGGRSIGAIDMLIAAQARTENATLVTSDLAFAGITGVDVLVW